ncbi:MAG: AsmA-like C-terminal region-containing protein [Betaproteobacteria bacterium]|nr:AsmA-like C-terminal region-containing protein [Betaproteobacteria bacterium]
MPWGSYVGRGLLLALVVGFVGVHLVPFSTEAYERAAKDATGMPVKIGSLQFSLISGGQFRFEKISIGPVRIGAVRMVPEFGSLFGDKLAFSKVEIEAADVPQDAIGQLFLGSVKAAGMKRAKIVATKVKLFGSIQIPALDADIVLAGDGGLESISFQGPDKLMARLERKGNEFAIELLAGSFSVPFGQGVVLSDFGMKGNAGRQGMVVKEWSGLLYEGPLSGSARIKWGGSWSVDGDIKARNVNAGVFAPALISSGKAEGQGVFSMSASDPAKLLESAQIRGDISIERGVLGSIDISRAVQSGGKQSGGRTEFTELKANVIYDRGAIAVRGLNVTAVPAGARVGGSAEIAANGTLSGRVTVELKAPAAVRTALVLSGDTKEPRLGR